MCVTGFGATAPELHGHRREPMSSLGVKVIIRRDLALMSAHASAESSAGSGVDEHLETMSDERGPSEAREPHVERAALHHGHVARLEAVFRVAGSAVGAVGRG